MDILTIASQKGDAEKTTLTAHLAAEAERTGVGPVAVVDTDLQGSLAAWWHQGAAETPLEAPIALTVKLDPELYFQLKRRGMCTKPCKTNQEMIVEAIRNYQWRNQPTRRTRSWRSSITRTRQNVARRL